MTKSSKNSKPETHRNNRTGWLRAAVLGVNDGILSTASIVSGVAAGGASHGAILLAGLAGLVAGATSMATGEYVSVSSQADTEQAELTREKRKLKQNPKEEHKELAQIYVGRGLDLPLAKQVAKQLMAHNALAAHAHDELGINDKTKAKPIQAALASATSFTCGAILPLFIAVISPLEFTAWAVAGTTLISLAILGALGAKIGRVKILKPTLRVLFWGAISLGLTNLIGHLVGSQP